VGQKLFLVHGVKLLALLIKFIATMLFLNSFYIGSSIRPSYERGARPLQKLQAKHEAGQDVVGSNPEGMSEGYYAQQLTLCQTSIYTLVRLR
jgi:hypothetical protein